MQWGWQHIKLQKNNAGSMSFLMWYNTGQFYPIAPPDQSIPASISSSTTFPPHDALHCVSHFTLRVQLEGKY